jgi:hypothetical protein
VQGEVPWIKAVVSAKTEKSKTIVWLCVGAGVLGVAVAAILASLNQSKAAIWVTWVSLALWLIGARTYVAYKHPAWKLRATFVAVAATALLVPVAWWLHHSAAVVVPSLHVESKGDQGPNVVGNQGPVTIQSGDPATEKKQPKNSPKSEEKNK